METEKVIAVRKDDEKVSALTGWNIMTADEIHEMFEANRDAVKGLHLCCVETGYRAIFTFATKGRGFTKGRRAYFRHAAGMAPPTSHVFDKKQGYNGVGAALADDAKILLSLNLSLPYAQEDFSRVRDFSVLGENEWKAQNKYLSISVKNAGDVIKIANRVKKLGGDVNHDISVLSQKGVMPFLSLIHI